MYIIGYITKDDMDFLSTIFQNIVSTAKNAFVVIDQLGTIIIWNQKAEDIFGWKAEQVINKSFFESIVPERVKLSYEHTFFAAIKDKICQDLPIPIELSLLNNENKEIITTLNIHSVEVNNQIYFIADISDCQHYIVESPQQFSLLNLTRDSIFVLDSENKLIFWNGNCEKLYGYTNEEVLNKELSTILDPVYPISISKINKFINAKGFWEGEIIYKHKTGKTINVLSRWSVDEKAHSKQIVVTNINVTKNKSYQKKIHYLITHDSLTGLGNRSLLEDRLQHAINQAVKNNSLVAVLFIDLNRFKKINDNLGHDNGDLLLKEIARRLNDILCKGDTIIRLGGDEFVILLENIHNIENIGLIAERVLLNIEKSFVLGEHEVNISSSIGISVYPKDAKDYQSLMKMSNLAMYQAKEMGSSAFRFYDPEMNNLVLTKFISENSLYRAINNKEFVVYYQPRINAKTKHLSSVEALVRWKDPIKGLISPVEFIPLAEEIGLVGLIGEWVLFEACRQAKLWQDMGFPRIKVSVNLSAQQLSNNNLVTIVERILETTKLEAKYLELEITESGLMKNFKVVNENLLELKKLGVYLAIDDFGTGYSSLSYLKNLPVDVLKIDKSFIDDLGNNSEDETIVTATIAMAHGMDLEVVAEGVNNMTQVDFLLSKNCDEMQGYLFSEPYPPEIIEQVFYRENWF